MGQIKQEFLQAEVDNLTSEIARANEFIIRAQGVIAAYNMLINTLNTPEETGPVLVESNENQTPG